jgi:hypothetical protein
MTTQPALSTEDKLVLYLVSRSLMDNAHVGVVTSVLTDRIDWDSIVQSATRYGIAPLLYRTLSRIDNDSAVPPEVREKLRTEYAPLPGASDGFNGVQV